MASHRHREDLTGEHPAGDAGQLALLCLFAVVWIADTFFLRYTTFLNQAVPLWFRVPLGVALMALAVYLARAGLSTVFGERPATARVIREGVLGVVRHPVYLGEILLYLGLLMLSMSLATAVVWLLGVVFLHRISRYEERLLVERFGEEYAQYVRDVPMWIPKLRR